MSLRVDSIWYANNPLSLLLAPLGWIYAAAARLRRAAYAGGLLRVHRVGVPVIVVGNLSVGGTGKTPLVIWTAQYLRGRGLRPGIVTRGYGGRASRWPQQVRGDSDPFVVGDEPVLIARATGCPVVADPDRVRGARALVSHAECDLIVSDDGLQHLALGRDVEIVVVDGIRRHGNRRCLPAGPLREPLSRLRSVDLVVSNGAAFPGEFEMELQCHEICSLLDHRDCRAFEDFAGIPVHAVCAIGHPQRFFRMLRARGIEIRAEHAFPDHHPFTARDLAFGDDLPIIMTEKDAVKVQRFAAPQHWMVPARAALVPEFGARLMAALGVADDAEEA